MIAPSQLTSETSWHYELETRNDDPAALVERARELRERTSTESGPQAAKSEDDAPAASGSAPPDG